MTYLLITPIKNEEKNLIQLKETVLAQTIQPLMWVIVDSGSVDSSYSTAKEIFEKYGWIHIIKQKTFYGNDYSHVNFAQAINEGVEYLDLLASKKNINYSFIAKTDATPLLEKNYFEELIKDLEKDPKLGIVCGTQIFCSNLSKEFKINPIFGIKNTGFNDIRLYRKEFLKNMGGYPLSYSPDTVLLIKASSSGWKYKISKEVSFYKTRIGGSKIGKWKGFKLKGKGMHYLGYHPLLVIINSMYAVLVFPRSYQGFAIILGYLSSILRKQKKIDDMEVLEYFRKKRLQEILKQQK